MTTNEFTVVPGKRLGRLPASFRASLNISNYLTGEVPSRPATADHISSVPVWNLGGNNQFSTCGPTSVANYITSVYKYLTGLNVTVADEHIYALYRLAGNPLFNPVTGAGDNGVDMNVLMDAWIAHGIWATNPNGSLFHVRPLAAASVNANDLPVVQAATALFGGVLFGMNMKDAQQTQQIWTPVPGSPEWGGHAVFGGAYTEVPDDDEQLISWAAKYGTTDSFIETQAEEAFVPILPILLASPDFVAGVNVAELAADWKALTGKSFPAAA